MKITKSYLRKIIKEEISSALREETVNTKDAEDLAQALMKDAELMKQIRLAAEDPEVKATVADIAGSVNESSFLPERFDSHDAAMAGTLASGALGTFGIALSNPANFAALLGPVGTASPPIAALMMVSAGVGLAVSMLIAREATKEVK